MSTHRSLNKLEFKAHMSIHNFVEVPEGEVHESKAFTRDRLGKKHLLVDESGASRIGNLRKKTAAAALSFIFLWAAPAGAEGIYSKDELVRKKGPNVQVSSSDVEIRSVSSWMNDNDTKPELYQTGSSALNFSESGDPNVSTRF